MAAAAFGAVLLLAPTMGGAQTSPAQGAPPDGRNLSQEAQKIGPIALPSLAPLARRVLPAVVNISVEMSEQAAIEEEGEGSSDVSPAIPGGTPFDQFLRRFFQNPAPNTAQQITALGSGFIIDPEGDIVTNNHVVAHASKVTIIFQDGSRHPAKVVGRDQKTDLALVKIETDKKLPFVTWGNSDDVKVGDWVVAVGNPFGLGGSVTAGIVSALGRNIDEGPYDDFLQIDAPINRGNSGGPTFDLSGQVIGINTAIYSPSGGSVGIGFAVPSNIAKHVVEELKAHGKVDWGWLGVAIQNITPPIAKSLSLKPNEANGALVASVVPNSPAAKAGLKSGDVITAAGGHKIRNVHDLPRLVAEQPIGSKLDLSIDRDGKSQTITAAIGAMPEHQTATAETRPPAPTASALGLELGSLTPQLRRQLKIGPEISGVVVLRVAANSPAQSLGLEPGDVIVSIDRQPVGSPNEAAAQLKKAAAQGNVLLLLNRHGTSEFVGLSVEGNGGNG
ncbi:MAG TPA: DegQ family serine endoprotease [Stellaceae bacterium]|nr:DegQ family serine endoprotease [Stellaceae bacterium]